MGIVPGRSTWSLDSSLTMSDDRTIFQELIFALGFGLLVAFIPLWFAGGLVASWAAGTTWFLCVFAFARMVDAPRRIWIVVGFTVSGAIAGVVWSQFATPPVSWFEAAAGGGFLCAFVGAVEMWREWRDEQRAV